MRISFISKVTRLHKAVTVANNTVYVPPFWLCFLNSLPSTWLKFPLWTHQRICPGNWASPVTGLIWRGPDSWSFCQKCNFGHFWDFQPGPNYLWSTQKGICMAAGHSFHQHHILPNLCMVISSNQDFRTWIQMMPIFDKGDDVRRETKANVGHSRLLPVQELMGLRSYYNTWSCHIENFKLMWII